MTSGARSSPHACDAMAPAARHRRAPSCHSRKLRGTRRGGRPGWMSAPQL